MAKEPSNACEDAAGLSVLSSPAAPWKGAPLRVIFAVEKPFDGELSLIAPDGSVAAKSHERHGGPPYFWYAEAASPAAGDWQARLVRPGESAECKTFARQIAVLGHEPPRPGREGDAIWPLRNSWNRGTENLYSAWIEKLFDAPLDAAPSWPALHEVLRDRSRNILFNHLGLGEDSMGMVVRPDCADLPYFLRAYFSFKMGLPFGYSKCSRGGGGQPPRCGPWFNIQNPEPPPAARPEQPPLQQTSSSPLLDMLRQPPPPPRPVSAPAPRRLGLAAAFGHYLQTVGDAVHSGSARTAAADENNDYYPVPLKQDTLRPGTVYADPYGHVLMLVQARAADGGRRGRLLRRGRPARWNGCEKALLARQFPVRTEPGARWPRIQAFPANRREERRLAAAHQCRDRGKSPLRRLLPGAGPARSSRSFTTAWTT